MKPRVLITARTFGRVATRPAEWLEEQGYDLVFSDLPKPVAEADLAGAIAGFDGLICGNDRVTARVFEAADRLRVVSRQGTGVDNIDLAAAEAHGVVVTNTPGTNTDTVAELAVGLMFALARRIVPAHVSTSAGGWERFIGTEVQGKTVGIVGLGKIGKAVARRAAALGAQVIAFDPARDEEFAARYGVEYVELDDLLRRADFVTLHLPLNAETQSIISRERLALMRPGSFLINAARGGLVDEAALAEALGEGRLAGAALDCFDSEPPAGSPLLGLDNCITLPHIGAYTKESLERMGMMVAENLDAVLKGKQPHSIVAGTVRKGDEK